MRQKHEKCTGQEKAGILRKAVTVCVAAVFLAGSWLFWKYQDELFIPLQQFKRALGDPYSRGQVKCSVVTTVEGTHCLLMKFAIPCEDMKQRLQLTRNLPKLKNQLMMKIGEPEMKEAVKNRDFETIRQHVLAILHTISGKSPDTVYFESFIYD
jgi:hypothetical protein